MTARSGEARTESLLRWHADLVGAVGLTRAGPAGPPDGLVPCGDDLAYRVSPVGGEQRVVG
jgi:hypothetical protein